MLTEEEVEKIQYAVDMLRTSMSVDYNNARSIEDSKDYLDYVLGCFREGVPVEEVASPKDAGFPWAGTV